MKDFLQVVFSTQSGKTRTIRVPEPNKALSGTDVTARCLQMCNADIYDGDKPTALRAINMLSIETRKLTA